MPCFSRLPRELRDYIYEECLKARTPVDLRNLADKRQWPSFQRLGLSPSLLGTCRKIMEEGLSKLYGENAFFIDLQAIWQLSPTQLICTHSQFNFEICTLCQQAPNYRTVPLQALQPTSWSPHCARISHLQILLRQYTYSEWKYRIPSSSLSTRITYWQIPSALPSGLRLSLLSVKIQERSMIPIEEVHCLRSWQTVALGMQGRRDLRRITRSVLHFGRHCADTIVLCQPDSLPQIITTPPTKPRYVRQLLRKGGAVEAQVSAITANEHASGYLGRLQQKVNKIAMDDGHHHIISIDGLTMAMTSIYL